MHKLSVIALLAVLAALVRAPSSAADPPRKPPIAAPGDDAPIDAARRTAAIKGLADALRRNYVFPDKGEQLAAQLTTKLAAGGYKETTAAAFADALTRELQAFTNDRHLRVRFDPDFRPRLKAEPSREQLAEMRRRAAWNNFGITKVERLAGNVGLIDLRVFLPKQLAAEPLAAAMSLVAGTEALIIDLRQHGGGHPETVAFLCSYFFPEGKRIHLNDIYDRPANKTEQFWTEPTVPGARYTRPVYLLTSGRTFSGAEEFAYDLQTQKRATIVGEVTGGGAHPGEIYPIGGGFAAFISTGRAINPITKTNWEGVGVKPDVSAPAAQALQLAHAAALRTIIGAEKDPELRKMLEGALERVERGEPEPVMYKRP